MFGNYLDALSLNLKKMQVTTPKGALSIDEGVDVFIKLTQDLQVNGATMYMVGNGASATMASHMSLDATKNGGIKVQAFNDIASLTALGNDLGYNEVFAFPVSKYAEEKDVLLTISSSGNSPNIIRAIEAAREVGMTVITLSAMKEDNRSRAMGDLNFFFPTDTYGMAECVHQVLLHYWLDLYITRNVEGAALSLCLPDA